MDETGTTPVPARRTWLKRTGIALGIFVLALVAFHRPILHAVVRGVAVHFAAKENLKLDLRVEGSVLGGMVLRNLHASATGPSAVQSADVDLLRVDYSLWGYLRGGMSQLLQDIEVRNASIVLDPAKAPPPPEPKMNQKFTLPAFFPDRLTLSDVTVRMASQPDDFLVQHLFLELRPDRAGELRIAKLQLPNGRSWSDVTAQTTYENRNLYLRNLVLDDQTQLSVVNIDASKIGENKLDVGVKGEVAGGKIDTSISLGAKDGSAQTKIDLAVEHTSIDAVRKYLQPAEAAGKRDAAAAVGGAAVAATGTEPKVAPGDAAALVPKGIDGDVKNLSIHVTGEADRPSSWNGTITAEINNLGAGGSVFDHATIDVAAADGKATIRNLELRRGANEITLQGTVDLPETKNGFGHQPANIQLRGKLPDLAGITAGLPQPVTGSAEINGQIKVANDTVTADVALAGGPIDFGAGTAQKFVAKLNATKKMPPPEEEHPYFYELSSEVTFDVNDVRARDYAVDSLHGVMQSAGQELNVQELLVRRAANELTLSGTYQLPVDFANAAAQPAAVTFQLGAPEIGAFWATDSPAKITGQLQANGRLNYQQRLGDGYFELYGSGLAAQHLNVHELSVQGTTANNTVYLNDLTVMLNAHDSITAHGEMEVQAPFPHRGVLAMNIADLATFEPVLRAAGKETKLGGALALDWHGSGVATKFENTGALNLKLEHGRYGNLEKLQASVEANYSPQALNVPIVFFSSDKMIFQAVMQTHDRQLEITKIEIDQGQSKYGGGYVKIPFVWENIGTDRPLFPADGEVLVSVQSENLAIGKLAKDFGTSVPVAGAASLKLDAHGPLSDLHATLDLKLAGLRSDKFADFKPATFGITARLENNQLVVNGKLEQVQIAPVQIDANLPFNVAQILEAKRIDESTPVNAKVRMPSSSVNFVREFVPALERIDGTAALDVNVGGTIAKPVFSGDASMAINFARFSNPTLPALTNFKARLDFSGDTLTLQQFRGDVAGGPFTASGRITFPKLTEPAFDLQLKADSVLVARNDNLTARVDANISVNGPLAGATVSGNVAITNSRFLKNIDLIPIGLPGRPAPAPEPPAATPDLSFPNPPLRDWKFDVAIKTKDPFLIRGNLANGGALVDMKLTGTGLAPKIDGSVRLQNVEATLPFSRLEISQGFLYFNPEDPFNPGLDLQGTSLIKDYTVHVYVYGTKNSPEAVFTSEPPLPQEEIITLLATGTTREELLSGGNVLAGRALMLLGKQLYQRVFKKGQTAANTTDSVFDRLQVDVGNVDPRTGQQTATARYRVNEKVQLVGDIGVQGDFRGTVRYLIRFR
ncbi:MAG: translocation/assembly module TamB domain-containing protein [Chthoniobacterales bacterium]|nr:translocation/assembly module TamB domain-containing protein [Chthoniobacterales bacterium]